jgi:hypothetical protein
VQVKKLLGAIKVIMIAPSNHGDGSIDGRSPGPLGFAAVRPRTCRSGRERNVMATAVSAGAGERDLGSAAPMSHRQIMEALSGLLIGLFVAILSSTVVSNALPTIIADCRRARPPTPG